VKVVECITGIFQDSAVLRSEYFYPTCCVFNIDRDACVRDWSGKPTDTRYEWRGLATESPAPRPAAAGGHAPITIIVNLVLQLNKGSEINNLAITGQFTSPGGADAVYYNIPFEKYTDAKGKCSEQYAGIVIDYDGSINTGGSTGVKIHDVLVGNFSINYLVSPNGKTFNADILLFENIRCGDARVGFATGQAQEKGNVIRGTYSWGSIHTLISIGRFEKAQAGNYVIDGGNVAGRCIRLFDISQSGWYASSVNNLFAESIATIGCITTQLPTSISNATFHFVFPEVIGKQTLFYSSNNLTRFSNCIFRYYGSNQAMKFSGDATYDNCLFSGVRVE